MRLPPTPTVFWVNSFWNISQRNLRSGCLRRAPLGLAVCSTAELRAVVRALGSGVYATWIRSPKGHSQCAVSKTPPDFHREGEEEVSRLDLRRKTRCTCANNYDS